VSRTVLFAIGTVIFFAVAAAVFLYGLAVFRELQDRDEADTFAYDAEHASVAPTASG
jgi:hypothetical protein